MESWSKLGFLWNGHQSIFIGIIDHTTEEPCFDPTIIWGLPTLRPQIPYLIIIRRHIRKVLYPCGGCEIGHEAPRWSMLLETFAEVDVKLGVVSSLALAVLAVCWLNRDFDGF